MGNDIIGMYRLSIGMFYIRAYSSLFKKMSLLQFWYFEFYKGNALFTELYEGNALFTELYEGNALFTEFYGGNALFT